MNEAIEKANAQAQQKERWWFHWQNLNYKKGGGQGSGWRHGRCWWHFPRQRTIQFSWNFWAPFCGVGFDVDDEDLTLSIAVPPVALWLIFSMNFWPLTRWPRIPLSENYPDTMVIDQRECCVKIHGGRVWIHPWSKTMEWVKRDSWWVRGVSFSINPFESKHMRHEVRRADGSWVPSVGSWELGRNGVTEPDGREVITAPYRYVLKRGEVQERIATISVERRAWRPRCFQWTSLFEKVRTCIDVQFSDEVGEKSGSWKGGCVGCGYELRPNETALECLRRMEMERKF